MVEIIKLEWLNADLITLLRWEDDGGKTIGITCAKPDLPLVQPMQRNGGRHGTSLQWNGQFVIEPFQAGTRIDLIKRKVPIIARADDQAHVR